MNAEKDTEGGFIPDYGNGENDDDPFYVSAVIRIGKRIRLRYRRGRDSQR